MMTTTVSTYPDKSEPPAEELDEVDLNTFSHTFQIVETDKMELLSSDVCEKKSAGGNKYRMGTKYYYYKPFEPINHKRMIQTIQKFEKIKLLANKKLLKMCRLHGVVYGGYAQDGVTYLDTGLVYHWINFKDGWKSLADVVVLEKTTSEQQDKWLIQIQRTVAELHRIHVPWGDARADSVMIDQYNNAVLIDLEGGYTPGWIDKDLKGTLQGDMQALSKLMTFIYNKNCPHRREILQAAKDGRRDWGFVSSHVHLVFSQYFWEKDGRS